MKRMYSLKVRPKLDKKLSKLFQKNRKQYDIIFKKAAEISENPQHYKNLRAPLQFLKEVHIDSHFVLTFSVDEDTKTVFLENFCHHKDIFRDH
jgi:YafQ family addiction module toxin component